MFRFLRGVKNLKCQVCGKKYPVSEFEEIMVEVTKGGNDFPQYSELLQCLECWGKKRGLKDG